MRVTSKTKQLVELREKNPDWTNQQYADYLGMSNDTVRSLLHRMGLSRKKRGRPSGDEVKSRPRKKVVLPDPPAFRVYSKAGPRSHGYTKLL